MNSKRGGVKPGKPGFGKGRFKGEWKFSPEPEVNLPVESPANLDTKTTVTIRGTTFEVNAHDLQRLELLGQGAFGTVEKRIHKQTGTLMAVKHIPCTLNSSGQTLLMREIGVCIQSQRCQYIVTFYGALFIEGSVWICMEVMDVSLAKFYPRVFNSGQLMPHEFLGVVSVSVLSALHYLKSELKVIHRDVKPSNVLVNRQGQVKICDFGICGHLVDSKARTQVGCEMYMAPERLDSTVQQEGYDIRSDVWSLGITLIELATGKFPYKECKTPFDQIIQVVNGEPPSLSYESYPPLFCDFIAKCLQKEYRARPKYDVLLQDPFIVSYSQAMCDISPFVQTILDLNPV